MAKQQTQTGLLIEGLSYSIGNRVILDQLDWQVPCGQTCLVVGPSGCGKTTLLSLLAGLEAPSQGRVCYDGVDFYRQSESQRDQFRGSRIGVLFQNFHLVRSLSVRQNVLLGGVLASHLLDIPYIDTMLERLKLADKANQKVRTLSVGEAQRLALARALANKPAWLLCDEPTSSLDDANALSMLLLIEQEAKKIGTTVIIVTHDSRVAKQLKADQTFELGEIT